MVPWKETFIEKYLLDITILHTPSAPSERIKKFFKVGKSKDDVFIKTMESFKESVDSRTLSYRFLVDESSTETESYLFLYIPNIDIGKHGKEPYVAKLIGSLYRVMDDLVPKFKPSNKEEFIAEGIEYLYNAICGWYVDILNSNQTSPLEGLSVMKLLKE